MKYEVALRNSLFIPTFYLIPFTSYLLLLQKTQPRTINN